jgi:hypothetical protein
MALGFYFSSPLKMGMGMGIPELYGFGFGESKIRPRPAPLPCLHSIIQLHWAPSICEQKSLAYFQKFFIFCLKINDEKGKKNIFKVFNFIQFLIKYFTIIPLNYSKIDLHVERVWSFLLEIT